MGQRIFRKFRTHIAEQLLESLSEAGNTAYYVVLARQNPFVQAKDGGTDASPPDPPAVDHYAQHTFFHEFISGKLVSPSNASLVVRRFDWVTGRVYSEYNHMASDQYGPASDFYVLTDDNNVYKCLFNNNGANSTVEPTGTATTPFTTSDGYTWKYMASLTSSQREKFLTTTYMPVKFLTSDDGSTQYDVQAAAVDGAVDVIKVANSGSNYRTHDSGTITSVTNSTAIRLASSANNSADNFYVGAAFYVTGGTGAGQLKEIIEYTASTREVIVNSAFSTTLSADASPSKYKISPLVTITSPDGSGAKAISTVNPTGNTISNVTVITAGSGYFRANAAISANSVHGSGAKLMVLVPPKGGHGNNIVQELGADKVMFYTPFVGDESNTVPVGTSFRKIAVVKNPLFSNGTQSNATSTPNIQYTTRLEHTSGIGFQLNEFITGATSKAEGRVVAANATHVYLNNVDGTFANNEQLVGNTTTTFSPTVGKVFESDMINTSGELLYVQSIRPVTRVTGQTEDIKIILDF